jgi:DNA modification methylase
VSDLWLLGDTRERLRDLDAGSAQTCVTSPPYWGLRDYGVAGQIGMEATFPEYVDALVGVFREVRRVLRDDGTLWLNLGDCYATGGGKVGACPGGGAQGAAWAERGAMTQANRMPQPGLKPKDLVGIPWRVAFALQGDGWWLRSDVIWQKPNPMPSSVADRPTPAHEYVFLLTKSERYHYDAAAIAEPAVSDHPSGNGFKREARLSYRDEVGARGNDEPWTAVGGTRNRRTVWTIPTQPFAEAHFATMPPALAEPCILAGAPVSGVVLDPFGGAGTTALVARRLGRRFVHIELNPDYLAIARRRVDGEGYQAPLFATGAA